MVKSGAGTWTLSGGNTFSGLTTVQTGTLRLGASNALPATTAVVVGASPTPGPATFDLNGKNQTIASLQLKGGSSLGSSSVILGSGVLTVPVISRSSGFGPERSRDPARSISGRLKVSASLTEGTVPLALIFKFLQCSKRQYQQARARNTRAVRGKHIRRQHDDSAGPYWLGTIWRCRTAR